VRGRFFGYGGGSLAETVPRRPGRAGRAILGGARSRAGRLRRLLPALALAQIAGVVAADAGIVAPRSALGCGVLACAAGLLFARSGCARAGLARLAAAAAGAAALGQALAAADAARPVEPFEATIEATVAAIVALGGGASRVELEAVAAVPPTLAAVPERVELWLSREAGPDPGLETALPGDRVRARVRLAAPDSRRNPGTSDTAVRARRSGIGAAARVVHPALVVRLPEREGWRPLAPLHALRVRAGARLSALGRGGDLLRALALGDQGALPDATREACAALGLSHILSVSGLHLALLAALVFAVARRALARPVALVARCDVRRPALALAVACAAAYALLAGGAVPVRRSLVLLVALALSVAARRRAAWPMPLAAASLAVLAVEPQAVFDPGAQLSFAGSAALAAAIARPSGAATGRVRRLLEEGLRASATATLATAPLAALHFGRSAPLALLANAVAVPWTGWVLLPGALLATAAAAAPPVAALEALLRALARVADGSLAACEAVALRVGTAAGGAPPCLLALVAALGLSALGLRAATTAVRAGAALALGALLAIAPPARVAPDPTRIVFLDVGQGDAVLVQSAQAAVLVDGGGSAAAGSDVGRRTVLPALRALGVRRLELVAVSHGDLDHRGGIPAVLRGLAVREVWIPFGARADPAFAEIRRAARETGARLRERVAGTRARELAGLAVAPLWPPRQDAGASRNDRSLVLRIDAGARRVLLPGDLEAGGEAELLARGADLRADVLKLGHHGSRTSSTAAWLEAVDAAVVVASAPCAGRFAMPHAEVVARARAAGAALWWTGRDGAVRVGLGPRLHVLGTGDSRACPTRGAAARSPGLQ
jgi:competence protein ComEC